MAADRPESGFMEEMRALELAYLHADDEVGQSGFGAGRERWVTERSPLVEAIASDGSFLDVGCANGLLAQDVVTWSAANGRTIEPHGIDLGEHLVAKAKLRMPRHADHFVVADAWSWEPTQRWDYVYSLVALSPPELMSQWLNRLSAWVNSGGRLIIGSYGSKSRGRVPADVASILQRAGHTPTGESSGGDVTRFAWADIVW